MIFLPLAVSIGLSIFLQPEEIPPSEIRIDLLKTEEEEAEFGKSVPDLVFKRVEPNQAEYMGLQWETTEPFWMMETELSNAQAAVLLGFGKYQTFVHARCTKARSDIGTDPNSIHTISALLDRPESPYIGVSLDDAFQLRIGIFHRSGLPIAAPTLAQWTVGSAGSTDHAVWCKDTQEPPEGIAWGSDLSVYISGTQIENAFVDVDEAGTNPIGIKGTIGNVAELVLLTEEESERVANRLMSSDSTTRFGRLPTLAVGGNILSGSMRFSHISLLSTRDLASLRDTSKIQKPKQWDKFLNSCTKSSEPIAMTQGNIGSYTNSEASPIGIRFVITQSQDGK